MTDPISRAATTPPRRREAPAPARRRDAPQTGETNVLVRLPTPVHRRFRGAATEADLHQSDLYRALVLMFLEDEELAARATDRARLLRDA